jgi:CrcB protein
MWAGRPAAMRRSGPRWAQGEVMLPTFCVAIGGAVGSVGRYWVGLLIERFWGGVFPLGTLLINVAGSLLIGWIAAAATPDGPLPDSTLLRLLLMTGLCGGFTTFSAFSLQTLMLLRAGDWPNAGLNILLSVALCLLATMTGHWLAMVGR